MRSNQLSYASIPNKLYYTTLFRKVNRKIQNFQKRSGTEQSVPL